MFRTTNTLDVPYITTLCPRNCIRFIGDFHQFAQGHIEPFPPGTLFDRWRQCLSFEGSALTGYTLLKPSLVFSAAKAFSCA